jgi:hypothetical protein
MRSSLACLILASMCVAGCCHFRQRTICTVATSPLTLYVTQIADHISCELVNTSNHDILVMDPSVGMGYRLRYSGGTETTVGPSSLSTCAGLRLLRGVGPVTQVAWDEFISFDLPPVAKAKGRLIEVVAFVAFIRVNELSKIVTSADIRATLTKNMNSTDCRWIAPKEGTQMPEGHPESADKIGGGKP